MQKFVTVIFFLALGAAGYFGYRLLMKKSINLLPRHETGTTERLLREQRYQSQATHQDYRRTIEDSRRAMEENRRAMEDLRRQTQR